MNWTSFNFVNILVSFLINHNTFLLWDTIDSKNTLRHIGSTSQYSTTALFVKMETEDLNQEYQDANQLEEALNLVDTLQDDNDQLFQENARLKKLLEESQEEVS
mgnify:CR=1 FL=1